MDKRLLLIPIVISVFLSINLVSAFYFFDKDYNVNDFKETTEFKQTTQTKTGDWWNYETTKRTITEETEIRKVTRTPNYYSPYNYGYYGNYKPSYSNWRYKTPKRNHIVIYDDPDRDYYDYYYKPRYDPQRGHYNWRW